MKLFIKYLKIYLPFILGIIFFSYGITNLVSSLLLFLGGYVAIKNTFDYRLLKKNINKINNCGRKVYDVNKIENKQIKRVEIAPISRGAEDIVGFKRTRSYTRVRRRY